MDNIIKLKHHFPFSYSFHSQEALNPTYFHKSHHMAYLPSAWRKQKGTENEIESRHKVGKLSNRMKDEMTTTLPMDRDSLHV